MPVIDDIKSRIDIVELISQTVKLRKSGSTYTGLCPFHAHKNNTPSFAVWPDSGTWKCFGQCNEGGDVFKFVMKRDGVDFSEALRTLAARAGVELKPRTPEEVEQEDNLGHLRQLLDAAVIYYHHLLKNAPGLGPQHAREHLAKRGLTGKAVELFQLGYALDSWDAGLKYFTGKGYSQKDLLDAGLIVEKEDEGKVFDRFRDRLMIPVRDEQGRMTGFQARALKVEAAANAGPKFMNSPQTALFDKGRTLFGLHLARKAIREAGAAIVVEGNLDVVAAHQAGFANVVSSQGTALTEHQLRLLKKYAKRIVLALDADEAGDAATLRGLTVAREALDREADFVFDPRGLVKTEGRLGTDIRVMTLPAGLDPDDVINRSPDEWRGFVEAAEPVVAYVMRVLTTGRNLDDPKVKTEVAEAILPLIEDVAQPIERDTYRQKLARLLKVDERALAVKRAAPKRRASTPAQLSSDSATPSSGISVSSVDESNAPLSKLEAYCLGALLRNPALVYKANRELQGWNLPNLDPDDFTNTEHQLIFRALQAALEQTEVDSSDHLRENLDPALQPYAEMLLSESFDPAFQPGLAKQLKGVRLRPLGETKAMEDLLTNIMRLRQHAEDLRKRELHFLAQEAREKGDLESADFYLREYQQHALAFDLVNRALARKSKRGHVAAPRLGVR
ncbi:MAG: DNA primase [Anaerolineales bacterium]|nr:DNA primase [Anaerolineales bacterium]